MFLTHQTSLYKQPNQGFADSFSQKCSEKLQIIQTAFSQIKDIEPLQGSKINPQDLP
jgi:hypothetical protein